MLIFIFLFIPGNIEFLIRLSLNYYNYNINSILLDIYHKRNLLYLSIIALLINYIYIIFYYNYIPLLFFIICLYNYFSTIFRLTDIRII
jgi:hypothetical protein